MKSDTAVIGLLSQARFRELISFIKAQVGLSKGSVRSSPQLEAFLPITANRFRSRSGSHISRSSPPRRGGCPWLIHSRFGLFDSRFPGGSGFSGRFRDSPETACEVIALPGDHGSHPDSPFPPHPSPRYSRFRAISISALFRVPASDIASPAIPSIAEFSFPPPFSFSCPLSRSSSAALFQRAPPSDSPPP
jgi:hypothetical protein